METLIAVQYDNDHYGEHESYTTTLEEFLSTFWFINLPNDVENDLATVGKTIIHNGFATTTATLIGEEN
jgi:hypothetical protein